MRCLIIDDEESIRKTTSAALSSQHVEAVAVESGSAALKQLENGHFDMAFLDLRLRGESGLDVLEDLRKAAPMLNVVLFSAHTTVPNIVEAMRRGAFDVLSKPFTPDQLRQVVRHVEENRKLKNRVAEQADRLSTESPEADYTTEEPALQGVYDLALRAADTPASILILGESGTGKSVLARFVHKKSQQADNAFVTVSCPTLSKELIASELFGHLKGAFTGAVTDTWGKVALADGGTLFLDEIGDLPLDIQPRLLRLLQEREYERVGEAKPRHANVRVIAATNRDLEDAVAKGEFRQDLFFRLNVIRLQMPPLRGRLGDLRRMADNYLKFFATQCRRKLRGFSPAATEVMTKYPWPGNLRELRNTIEHAVIVANGEYIEPADLPENMRSAQAPPLTVGAAVTLAGLEAEHIQRVIAWASSMEEAAKILGIDPATLYRKRKALGL
ncbi:MAG TPA: sigma-54 dependent transcriptional regulator [Verrucomicrobiae bacterium]|jgi:NtrC-family two-component system response regulator AlgB